MFEKEKGSISKRREDTIYNPIEQKWERKLTSKYLGDLEDFSFEKGIQAKVTDAKYKAISAKNKTKDMAKAESMSVHINDLKSTMQKSVGKLKELMVEQERQIVGDDSEYVRENQNEVEGDSEYVRENQNEVEGDSEYLGDESEQWNEDSEENNALTWLKIIVALIGLFIAFMSN